MKNLRSGLFLLLIAGCALSMLLVAGCGTDNPVSPDATIEQQVLQLVNQHRASKGLASLTMNSTISAQAQDHSQKMADGTRAFSHDGFDERAAAIQQTISISAVAENVAFNNDADPAAKAVDGWLNSPGHLANIEGDYNLTGIGVVKNSSGIYYFTQIFAKSK